MGLSDLLAIQPKAILLEGMLGMAFGARGGGRFAAHYEPGKLVINMTKIRGGGSMAHEWAHAMDHYFGELNKADAYTTQARGASGWYTEDQYRGIPRNRMERIGNEWKSVNKMRLDNLRPELAAAFDGVMQALFQKQINKAEMVRSQELRLERTEAMARMEPDAEMKAMYQRMAKNEREALEELRKDPEDKMYDSRGRTDFAKEAQALSGKSANGYWTRPTEMFARSFESWVFDRVTAMGARSDYLVHGVEADRFAGGGYKGNPYPTGEERARINAAFDKLVKTIQTKVDDAGNVAMFSRSTAFFAEVDAAIQAGMADDKKALRQQIDVGFRTPAVMRLLGVADKPVYTSRNLIAKMHFEHGLSKAQLKNLAALLENPAMVFKSDTQPGRLVVVTDLIANGRPVVVAVEPNGSSQGVDVVYLPSAYPKNNADGAFTAWIKAGNLLYADKSRSRLLATNAGLQLPGVIARPVGFKPVQYKTEADIEQGSMSRAQPAAGLPQKAAQDVADTIAARWANAPEIVVVANMQDAAIPEAVRREDAKQRSQGASGEPEGFSYGGKVYIVSSALNKPADVVRMLFHEALGHAGLRGVFGDSLKPILQQMATLRRAEVAAKAELIHRRAP